MIDSKKSFTSAASPLSVTIAGTTLHGDPRSFQTGSVGYFLGGKTLITLANGETVRCQVSCTVTAIGSKEWKD